MRVGKLDRRYPENREKILYEVGKDMTYTGDAFDNDEEAVDFAQDLYNRTGVRTTVTATKNGRRWQQGLWSSDEGYRRNTVRDSVRRVKDSVVDIEDAVYEKFINASAETRDELVELIDKNYDMEEFESTDDLANSLYNYLDFLLPQLSDDAVLDLQDSGYL